MDIKSQLKLKPVMITAFIGAVISAIVGIVFSLLTEESIKVCFSGGESKVHSSEDGVYVSEVFAKNIGDKPLENIYVRLETEISSKSNINPEFETWTTSFNACGQPENSFLKPKDDHPWRKHRSEFTCDILNPGEYLEFHLKYNKNGQNVTSTYGPMFFKIVFKAKGIIIREAISGTYPHSTRYEC